jgi:Arc/MetJ-type ribon-helix-helix transcriptional regulator
VTPPPRLDEVRRARSERIRAALRRWLEEEL